MDPLRRLLTFTIVGAAAQLVDGALGMGYGISASTLLVGTGATAAVASASVHLAEVGTTLASGLSHWRLGNVSWRTVRWLGVPGAAGAGVGALALTRVDAAAARPVVAAILLALGVFLVARFSFGVVRRPLPEHRVQGRVLGGIGAAAGFVDAVGGGGWGPISNPALLTVGRMEPRTAIGSAAAAEFLVSIAASAGFLVGFALDRQAGRGVEAALVGALLLGGVVAAPLAALLVQRVPARVLGTGVGAAVVLTNLGTVLASFGVAGPVRAACVALAGVVGAGFVARAWRGSREGGGGRVRRP